MDQLLLQAEILWPALLAGMLVLATHVIFGREVLQRGIIFLDLAVAQIAGLGVVVATLFWPSEVSDHSESFQTLTAVIAAIIGAMGLYSLRRLEVKIQEAIIGILFILAATGSILLLASDPHGGERLKEILVGQILWINIEDLWLLGAVSAIILLLWFWQRSHSGSWIFYPLFAITVTLSTQVVGVYLVFASLIIPALATTNQPKAYLRAFMLGTIGYSSGLIFSALFDLPAGAAIVWCLASTGLFYFLMIMLIERVKS